MTPLRSPAIGLAIALWAPLAAAAHDLSGQWRLEVQNLHRDVKATFTVRFMPELAPSCLGLVNPRTGKDLQWRRLAIDAMATTDSRFFPVADSLAYGIDAQTLTLGSVEICDGYALLQGRLAAPPVVGRYFSLGLGGSADLGFFRLTRIR
ncbi:MAG: hypothetical protein EKK53_10510 [Burkholderiales bacterium]|nr:MAG: hypothetical protein EKK53_10510 [Burkholderiales bacterium]